jgi:hypothetical protein
MFGGSGYFWVPLRDRGASQNDEVWEGGANLFFAHRMLRKTTQHLSNVDSTITCKHDYYIIHDSPGPNHLFQSLCEPSGRAVFRIKCLKGTGDGVSFQRTCSHGM